MSYGQHSGQQVDQENFSLASQKLQNENRKTKEKNMTDFELEYMKERTGRYIADHRAKQK